MKNNVLSAFVMFFAIVACLLILDDILNEKATSISKVPQSEINTISTSEKDIAISDLEIED